MIWQAEMARQNQIFGDGVGWWKSPLPGLPPESPLEAVMDKYHKEEHYKPRMGKIRR